MTGAGVVAQIKVQLVAAGAQPPVALVRGGISVVEVELRRG